MTYLSQKLDISVENFDPN